jgi:hypothetical protein
MGRGASQTIEIVECAGFAVALGRMAALATEARLRQRVGVTRAECLGAFVDGLFFGKFTVG